VADPYGSDDVSISIDMLDFFFVNIYFDMSSNPLKNISFNMDEIYLKYSFLLLPIGSYSSSHIHKTIIPPYEATYYMWADVQSKYGQGQYA